MRELLQNVINKMCDDEIPILFGEGSKIIIDDFNFTDYHDKDDKDDFLISKNKNIKYRYITYKK